MTREQFQSILDEKTIKKLFMAMDARYNGVLIMPAHRQGALPDHWNLLSECVAAMMCLVSRFLRCQMLF